MIAEWSQSYDANMNTGILLWDLSSAFDTIDIDVFCEKLVLFGVAHNSVSWFRSFLTNRKQIVEVGKGGSKPIYVSTGCPQGSLLSPLIFLIYIADMELWVNHASVRGYADDTATSVCARTEEEVISMLEADATRILKYMASNSLSASPKKTGFLFIRTKRSESKTIQVGEEVVMEQDHHKILGISVNNTLSWNDHITDELIPSVNRRIGSLRRISQHVPMTYLPQIASAIVGSKIRYGVAIYGSVRLSTNDPIQNHHRSLQVALNNAMRVAMGRRRSERVPITELCKLTKMQSLNRMSAEEKLSLVWCAQNVPSSPLADVFQKPTREKMPSRAIAREDLVSSAKSELSRRNVVHQAVRVWNNVDPAHRKIEKKASVKKMIRSFVNALPL